MSWHFENNIIEKLPSDCEAFVYLITNLTNNKKYVGKKLAKFKTTKPPLKGKKNKRRGYKESDWKTYWGSSDHLIADVVELGEDSFKREILYKLIDQQKLTGSIYRGIWEDVGTPDRLKKLNSIS